VKLASSFEYYDWPTDTWKTVIRSIEQQQEWTPAPRGRNQSASGSPVRLVGPAVARKAPKVNNQNRPDFPDEEAK